MPTNILSISAQERHFLTRSNADWLDGFPFMVAGSVATAADAGNAGNGTVADLSFAPGTPLGPYRAVVSVINGATLFSLLDPSGAEIATGAVGVPIYGAGLTFALNQGSTPFGVGDGITLSVLPAALDISDIRFDLQLRRSLAGATYPATVSLSATTEGSVPTLVNGGSLGILSCRVLQAAMASLPPATYDYDLLASADGHRVTAYYGTVEHAPGVVALPN